MINRLLSIAERIGVHVQYHSTGPRGWYSHSRRIISLHRDLGPTTLRCTLAHELAHAIRGDTKTGHHYFDKRMERDADRIAARLLISPKAYSEAEQRVGPHIPGIAQELGVTQDVVQAWQRWHQPTHLNSHTREAIP